MVAQTIQLPNVRKLFLPDPGFTLVEIDLARADAQVVAWESDDAGLKSLFRSGADIHTANALDIFGGPGPIPKGAVGHAVWDHKRQRAKIGVHAVNYGCRCKTLAEHISSSERDAQRFIDTWFAAHPGIRDWHKRTDWNLRTRSCVENIWGYKRHYFDRADGLLPEALAWIGQSTTAITINHSLLAIGDEVDCAQFLLQVHDSHLWQVPTKELDEVLPVMSRLAHITIPYSDPLVIPATMAISDKSWGDVHNVTFDAKEE